MRCLVPWMNHLLGVCWYILEIKFKQQLICKFDIVKPVYIYLQVSHNIMMPNVLFALFLLLKWCFVFAKYSCTLFFNKQSCLFLYIWHGMIHIMQYTYHTVANGQFTEITIYTEKRFIFTCWPQFYQPNYSIKDQLKIDLFCPLELRNFESCGLVLFFLLKRPNCRE